MIKEYAKNVDNQLKGIGKQKELKPSVSGNGSEVSRGSFVGNSQRSSFINDQCLTPNFSTPNCSIIKDY
jgi:hypothetical protein